MRRRRQSCQVNFEANAYVRSEGDGAYMHLMVMGLDPYGDPEQVEFLDGNHLNCQKENLRIRDQG